MNKETLTYERQLRDKLAAKVMVALIRKFGVTLTPKQVAIQAGIYADEMLKERDNE